MARIPGIIPIRRRSRRRRHAVTLPAKLVDGAGGELDRIPRLRCGRVSGMVRAGTVARLATDARLGRLDLAAFGKPQFPGRVALEAPQNRGVRSKRFVPHALAVSVPGRQIEATCAAIPAQPMLQIRILVKLADVGDRLQAGAESPTLRFPLQSARVPSFRLRCCDLGVTCCADRRSRVGLSGKQQRRGYHRKRPLYWNWRPL